MLYLYCVGRLSVKLAPSRVAKFSERGVFRVFESFLDFFKALKEAEFDFEALEEFIFDLYTAIMFNNSDMIKILSSIEGFMDTISAFIPYIVIVAMLVVALFGKKLLSILKFLTFFVVGFGLGVYFIPPLLEDIVNIPGWVSGLVVGILAAVLYRFVYIVLYSVAVCYSVYILVEISLGQPIVSLVVALVALILAFILKKYIEMLGTAMIAGYVIAITVSTSIYDYTTELNFLDGIEWVGILVVTLIVAIPGFLFQFKTRKRY